MGSNSKRRPDRPEPRDWFRVAPHAQTGDGSSADVYIYDVIGGWWGIEASDFVQAIAALDVDQLNLFVNSPGGDVYDAIAMTNALRRHPANVVATVDGLAASAASFLLTGANEVVMGQNSELMIHDAWSVAIGNAQDMRDAADYLDRVSQNVASMYAAQAGGTAEEWRDIMLAETWYSADEAVEAGLADRIAGDAATDAENAFDLSAYRFQGRSRAPKPPLERIAAMTGRDMAVDITANAHKYMPAFAEARPKDPQAATSGQPGSPATNNQPTTKGTPMADTTETEAPESQKVDENAIDALLAAKVDAKIGKILDAIKAGPAASPAAVDMLAGNKKKSDMSYAEAMSAFAAKASGMAPQEVLDRIKGNLTDGNSVFAALTNVGFGDGTSGGIANTNPPQWIGELVDRVPYASLWAHVAHADLTSPNVTGFQMVTKPTGGTKADNGGAVTSTGVKWSPVTKSVSRFAGGDSFDRMAFDFGISASALDGYFRAQTYNYFVYRDGILLTEMLNGLTAAEADAAPDGSAITDVTNTLLDGVVTVIGQGGGISNLSVIPLASFKSLIKNSREQAPAFLTIDLGTLTDGDVSGKLTVLPDPTGTKIAADNALVGNAAVGVTGYELPGVPLRAEQLQVSIGNIDVGLFGYCAAIRQSANFFTLVEPPAAG